MLLHPFLPRFFEQTRVKVERSPDIVDLSRAAALLHALAGGDDDEPYEHELGLIKVLLGLGLDDTLLVGGGLLEAADHEEIDALLRAVIDHWRALKATSPHGLRSTFLRRSGLVRADQHGFYLQVEPGPFDVVLSSLPWGLSIVKLPWMARPLVTEWVAS